jgi:hypothetical protein
MLRFFPVHGVAIYQYLHPLSKTFLKLLFSLTSYFCDYTLFSAMAAAGGAREKPLFTQQENRE